MAVDARRIAILGGGKIGESLLAGLLSSGWRTPEEIVVTGRRQERIDELAERYGVETTLSNSDAVSEAGFVVIAVKPQDFEVLLGEVGALLRVCLLYTSPSPRDLSTSRMPSSA